jgi:hypothetical protein
MDDFGDPLDAKLRDAAELLKAGQKKEARRLLREALDIDRNNLATWELLWRATYNVKEELHCLNRILAIDPNHAAAKRRLAAIHSSTPGRFPKRSSSRKKRQESLLLLLFLGSLISIVCVGVAGFALMRGGYIPFSFSNLTATASAQKNASCEMLINRAIQASDNSCDKTDSNNACYGNSTIKADLVPGATQRFSERGDIVTVNELQRLSASPLNLDSNEWGIAVLKVIANLPHSLPGETVTMLVFGNTTLDNDSGNLESFYFSSELGQITCEKVPFDGLMITSPDGSGVRFTVNGSELTLMGTASLRAQRNGNMEISLYRGSGRIVSNGEEQYFGAGQRVTVQLGGENGTESIGAPSTPDSLSQDELDIACTMTGQYCSQDEISLVSEEDAQTQIQSEITSTPTLTFTPTLTPIPSATGIPTNTLLVLPSATLSPRPTAIPTSTKTRVPTVAVTASPTMILTPTITLSPTLAPLPTWTLTVSPAPTLTFTSSSTSTSTPTFTNTPVPTPTSTFTDTPVPTPVPIGPTEPLCTNVSLSALTNPNNNEVGMNIINGSGGTIAINRLFVTWVELATSQRLDEVFLNGISVWNKSDPTPPSDIPAEGNWRNGIDLTIPDTATSPFLIRFGDDLQSTSNEVHIVFDIGCQVIGTK